jgi:hypothetical protein
MGPMGPSQTRTRMAKDLHRATIKDDDDNRPNLIRQRTKRGGGRVRLHRRVPGATAGGPPPHIEQRGSSPTTDLEVATNRVSGRHRPLHPLTPDRPRPDAPRIEVETFGLAVGGESRTAEGRTTTFFTKTRDQRCRGAPGAPLTCPTHRPVFRLRPRLPWRRPRRWWEGRGRQLCAAAG